MQLLKQQVGSYKQDIQLQVPTAKILIEILKGAAAITETQFDAMKIRVVEYDGSSSTTHVPLMPIRHAFGMSAAREGFFVLGPNRICGTIDLSKTGSLPLGNSKYVSINYEGLPADAIVNIWAVPVDKIATTKEIIEEVAILGTTKNIDVSNVEELFFPIDVPALSIVGIERIKVTYANSRVCEFDEFEVKALNDTQNDIVCVLTEDWDENDAQSVGRADIRFGFDRLLCLPVHGAVEVEITPKNRGQLYVYTTKSVLL